MSKSTEVIIIEVAADVLAACCLMLFVYGVMHALGWF